MASGRKARWAAAQRFAERLVFDLVFDLAFDEAPRLIRRLQQIPAVQEGIRIGVSVLSPEPAPAIPSGRPVTSVSAPTAARARTLVYAPDLAGRAGAGEVVWTWVAQPDAPTRGADRPVLVVGRDRDVLLGLLLSTAGGHRGDPDWVEISWEPDGPGWVRLDRVLDVPEESIRREGAILAAHTFELVAARLRADYAWS